jgi:hypothetical protein
VTSAFSSTGAGHGGKTRKSFYGRVQARARRVNTTEHCHRKRPVRIGNTVRETSRILESNAVYTDVSEKRSAFIHRVDEEFPHLLRNPKVHHRFQGSPSLNPLSSARSIQFAFSPYFKILSNILPSASRSSEWFPSFRSRNPVLHNKEQEE